MLISANMFNNQRVEKAVVLDSNYSSVEEQCIGGNREDSHVLPSQHVLQESHLLRKENTWRAALHRQIQL